jgi:dynein heavy chain
MTFCFPSPARLKTGLCAETKAWRVAYGKACNKKYGSTMKEVLEFMDDVSKRLQRPIKDLDDIRFAMAALKNLREEEIRIDMNLIPIEVGLCVKTWR